MTAAQSAAATSSWWTSWKGTPGSGSTGRSSGDLAERPAQRPRDALAERKQRDQIEQQRRFRPGDDAGAEDVGIGVGVLERLGQLGLDRGLVGGVGMARAALQGLVLLEQIRHAATEAVGGDRGGVDEPLRASGGGRLEDVARAGQVDLAAGAVPGDNREGEVDDDVSVVDQLVDGLAIEHVATPVLGLLPAVSGEVEGAPRHADHTLDLGYSLEGGYERPADLPGRPGDCDGQHGRDSGGIRQRAAQRPLRRDSGLLGADVDYLDQILEATHVLGLRVYRGSRWESAVAAIIRSTERAPRAFLPVAITAA